jgi:hypothetical protein
VHEEYLGCAVHCLCCMPTKPKVNGEELGIRARMQGVSKGIREAGRVVGVPSINRLGARRHEVLEPLV